MNEFRILTGEAGMNRFEEALRQYQLYNGLSQAVATGNMDLATAIRFQMSTIKPKRTKIYKLNIEE